MWEITEKNLYKHIYYCSTQDGCESTQITKESKMKYEAYHQVYSYTGYELDKLEEKKWYILHRVRRGHIGFS